MPQLVIQARFLAGTFLGEEGGQRPATRPDTARLFSALLNSAATGSTAVERSGKLEPAPESLVALQWLEEHPPRSLCLPETVRLSRTALTVYRDEGVMESVSKQVRPKKSGKSQSSGVAVTGPFQWIWDEDAPLELIETLDAICEDISYLGSADCPAIVETSSTATPTHLLAEDQGPFCLTPAERIRTPQPGRLAELQRAHDAAYPKKRPSLAADKATTTALPSSYRPPKDALRKLRYEPVDQSVELEGPWVHGWSATCQASIDPADVKDWCVTLRRALLARIPAPVPPLVTGHYPQGTPKHANRLAIHYVQPDLAGGQGQFLVLAPGDANPDDLAALQTGLAAINRLYRGNRGEIRLKSGFARIDARAFWAPPATGHKRLWRTDSGFIPEIRRLAGSPEWGLADAVRVAVGHVFKDRLTLGRSRHDARYREISRQVADLGVKVHALRIAADSQGDRYTHRLPKHLVTQRVATVVDLGDLMSDTALCAIGQSRHLGGGLLVPLDVEDPDADQ